MAWAFHSIVRIPRGNMSSTQEQKRQASQGSALAITQCHFYCFLLDEESQRASPETRWKDIDPSLDEMSGKEQAAIFNSLYFLLSVQISSVQFSSVAQSCPTLCNPMNCSTPGLPVHHQLPEFTQTHIHQVSDAIQPSHPLSSPSPPAPSPPPSITVFSNESILRMRWPKYWSFSFSTIPSKEIPGLTSFRMDWLDLPAVQGTLKSSPTPQFKSLNSVRSSQKDYLKAKYFSNVYRKAKQ